MAKSFGFSLQKLGLRQNAIVKLRKAVSPSLDVYIPTILWKNNIWKSWKTKCIRATFNKFSLVEKDSTDILHHSESHPWVQ